MEDPAMKLEATDLSKEYDRGMDLLHRIDNEDLESNGRVYQDLVKQAIGIFERLTESLNQLQVFSRNESVDEVATSELKFLLLPALLAYLTGKKTTASPADRKDIVSLCTIYYKDFIRRLNEYGVTKIPLSPDDESEGEIRVSRTEDPSLESMARNRGEKITRYRQKKEHEEREKELRQRIAAGQLDGEEDVVRQYHLCQLKRWSLIAIEELDSLSLEQRMLQQFSATETQDSSSVRGSGGSDASSRPPSRRRPPDSQKDRQPLRPFILTKDSAMKAVFGAGYPSIPAMTVDEFVDQKNADGTWAFTQHKRVYDNSLQNWAEDPDKKKNEDEGYEERLERLADQEDETEIRRLRQWDEFKDDVKRGEGNRKNMS